MFRSGPGSNLPVSQFTLFVAFWMRGRREPNTACFAWEGPELEISAARLAATTVFLSPSKQIQGQTYSTTHSFPSHYSYYQLMLFSGALHNQW
jgi:hypothetical protein